MPKHHKLSARIRASLNVFLTHAKELRKQCPDPDGPSPSQEFMDSLVVVVESGPQLMGVSLKPLYFSICMKEEGDSRHGVEIFQNAQFGLQGTAMSDSESSFAIFGAIWARTGKKFESIDHADLDEEDSDLLDWYCRKVYEAAKKASISPALD